MTRDERLAALTSSTFPSSQCAGELDAVDGEHEHDKREEKTVSCGDHVGDR